MKTLYETLTPGLPHAFVRGPEDGPRRRGPPDQTCALCQCDPRNKLHVLSDRCDRCYVPIAGEGAVGAVEAHRATCPQYGCRHGDPCRIPTGGGICLDCGYPRAYAHPDCVRDAFEVDAVWIGGTAMEVCSDSEIPRGRVSIVSPDRVRIHYQIPCRHASAAPVAVEVETLHDGLTARQCLERYVRLQREDAGPYHHALNDRQLAVARDLWSAELGAAIRGSDLP
jgi:hypothetical protein